MLIINLHIDNRVFLKDESMHYTENFTRIVTINKNWLKIRRMGFKT